MGKSVDDAAWIDELAAAREVEDNDGAEQPAEAEGNPEPALSDAAGGGAEEPPPAAEAEADDSRQIPLASHIEERNKLNAKIDVLEQQINNQGTTISQLRALEDQLRDLKAEREAPPPAPDYLDDPKAYVDHRSQTVVEKLQAIGDQVKGLEETQETLTSTQQQQQAAVAITQAAGVASAEFAKDNPDYWQALEHMRQVRQQQLRMAAPQATEAQVQQQIQAEEFNAAAHILQQGGNPAQYAYDMAKTFGYTAKPAEQDSQDLREKREQARGMGGSGTPTGELDQLLNKSSDEFEQAMSEMFGRSAT
jgi:hypothetical protein